MHVVKLAWLYPQVAVLRRLRWCVVLMLGFFLDFGDQTSTNNSNKVCLVFKLSPSFRGYCMLLCIDIYSVSSENHVSLNLKFIR